MTSLAYCTFNSYFGRFPSKGWSIRLLTFILTKSTKMPFNPSYPSLDKPITLPSFNLNFLHFHSHHLHWSWWSLHLSNTHRLHHTPLHNITGHLHRTSNHHTHWTTTPSSPNDYSSSFKPPATSSPIFPLWPIFKKADIEFDKVRKSQVHIQFFILGFNLKRER